MRDGEKVIYWTLQLLVACFAFTESLDKYVNSIFKKAVMITSADICTNILPRQSDEMLVVAKKQKKNNLCWTK